MSHDIRWYSPAPLWPKRLQNGTGDRLQRPELLQFKRDDFMAELQTTLEDTPNALDEKRAEGEKYLGRNGTTESVKGPIPLYQPAHERYYLVTASLVCRERGLPDRTVDTANEEKVAFVLRRLERADSDASKGLLSDTEGVNLVEVNGTKYVEYAWMENETTAKEEEGASGNGKKTAEKNREWRPLKEPMEQVPEKEERLSMFPKNYEPTTRVEAMKGPRRFWAGLIPVAKRDTYETAPVRYEPVSTEANSSDQEDEVPSQLSTLEESDDDLSDPRETKFTTRVVRPFYKLRERMGKADDLRVEDVRAPFLFAWLDLWQFLNTHLGDVVTEMTSPGAVDFDEGDPKSDAKLNLYRWLHSTELQDLGLGDSPASVLRSIRDNAEDIEGGYLKEVDDLNLENNGDTLNRSALKKTLNALLSPNEQGESLTEIRPDLQKKVFGALEALTDAEPLVRTTVSWAVPPEPCVIVLGIWESLIGLGLISGVFMRATLALLFLQMPGTLLPLIVVPDTVWQRFPFELTMEGQYILKNFVLIGAALVLGATVRGGRLVTESS